jgi:hypothetical protein
LEKTFMDVSAWPLFGSSAETVFIPEFALGIAEIMGGVKRVKK